MFKPFVFLPAFLLGSFFGNAQMTDMHWDTHGVGFKVPSDVRITTNNAEEFSAENANVFLTISPVQDGALNKDHMADLTVEMAKGLGYDRVDEGDAIDINDFAGYYVKGTKEGVNALVMALMDEKSTTNLLVAIVYNDGFEERAVEILASFYAYSQMTDMHWDTHGVGFKVPSDVRITTNNAEEFSADNGNVFLTIIPVQDGNLNKDHMADATVDMAKGLGYDRVDEGDAIEIDDFTGYYVKGTKAGTNAVVMALLDKKSTTNLLVVVVYNNGFEEKAVEILGSFYAYD